MRTGRLVLLAAVVALSAASCSHSPAVEFAYRVRFDAAAQPDKADVLARTIKVVQQRVGKVGSVEPRGEDHFVVKLRPPVSDADAQRLDRLVTTRGILRFSLVDDQPEDIKTARRGDPVANCAPFLPARDPKTDRIMRDANGRITRWRRMGYAEAEQMPPEVSDAEWCLVKNEARVTGEFLSEIRADQDPGSGAPVVAFKFIGKGSKDFEELTDRYKPSGDHPGRRLAIIVDDDLYSAPTIQSRISGSGVITGSFTKAEVEDLVRVLRTGQLPAPVERVPGTAPAR